METVLFFDVETNGLPSNDLQKTDIAETFKEWPRIWQLGWSLWSIDGTLISEGVEYLLPPFASGEWEKEESHPYEIDLQTCLMIGQKQYDCFPRISKMMHDADFIVCHNLRFDSRIFEGEMYRLLQSDSSVLMPPKKSEGKPKICTMTTTTKFCNLPFPSGRKGEKFPTLEELHTILFGENFIGAHDALADVRATAKCFFELLRRNVIEIQK